MTTAREQARIAACPRDHDKFTQCTKHQQADIASDVWEPLLRKYGQHKWPCTGAYAPQHCECGLSEALGEK